jgi:glutathione S-transferase
MVLPILYSFRRCPYAMRARMALWIGARQVELREVSLREKPVELLVASPKGTVPVLVNTDDAVIEQSLDIMLWSLRDRDPQDWLAPQDGSLDEMLGLIRVCDGEFKIALDQYKYPARFPDSAPTLARAQAAKFLMQLEHRLGRSANLFGVRPALADFAILPFVRQFAMVEPDWFAGQPWPLLVKWLKRHLEAPIFAAVMAKLEPWAPNRAALVFPAPVSA